MIEWLFTNAKAFGDVIALMTTITVGGIWVARRVLLSIKKLENLISGQANLAAAVTDISKQLKPNGGTSIFDVIKHANAVSERNNQAIQNLATDITRIRAFQWAFAEALTDKPVFEANDKGECVRVNGSYAKLAERNSPELLGSGWENFIFSSDRQRVFEEWTDAIQRRRIFESSYRVQSRSGRVYDIKCTAIPIFDDDGRKVTAYVGRFDEVREKAA